MKPYYYTFEWKDRVITLCLIEQEEIDYDEMSGYLQIVMGYSIKLPLDDMNEDLAKQISLGRAKKFSTQWIIAEFSAIIDENLIKDKGVLKAIARNCERNIKNGTIVIKGIR